MTGLVFWVGISPVGLDEADAPPASDNAPATPKAAVTALLRALVLEVCSECDMAANLRRISIELRPESSNQLFFVLVPKKSPRYPTVRQ